jgi:hypothetical protein
MAHRGDRETGTWFSDEQLAQLTRADEVEELHLPVPTQMISNGEHMPDPQTDDQRRVEARIKELADTASKKLGISRRAFFAGAGGMAASFLAMNEVYGRIFNVEEAELFEPAARAQNGPPKDLFVFDDQLHMERSSMVGPLLFLAWAQGPTAAASGFPINPFNPNSKPDETGNPWAVLNPALVGKPITPDELYLVNFIKDVFFDSQVTVGLLSNNTLGVFPPGDPNAQAPKNFTESQASAGLTSQQTAATRDFVNKLAGSRRMLAHGQLYPGTANLEFLQHQIDQNKPDAWKGYCISTSAKDANDPPDAPMRMWRIDDEQIAYPSYELITRNRDQLIERPGFWNICIHKGFSTAPNDDPEHGNPVDIPKAANDWPHFNFVIYHACFGGGFNGQFPALMLKNIKNGVLLNGVPNIPWTTQFGQIAGHLRNVYTDIGSTFAASVITFPTVCAHIMGQLLKYFGEDKVCFGTDCVYYGSPQWQIEALWRFEIPEAIREQFGYPELTEVAKRKILGLNSARLYALLPVASPGIYRPVPADYASRIPESLKTILEFPGFASDTFSRMREQYLAMGPQPTHERYGWVRSRA